jgi:hypothetical protein
MYIETGGKSVKAFNGPYSPFGRIALVDKQAG